MAVLVVTWRLGWLEYRTALALVSTLRRGGRESTTVALGYVFGFASLASAGFPSTPLLLAGGAIFGAVRGIALSWAGAMLGALGGYWLARAVGRDALCKLLGRRAHYLDRVSGKSGFLAVLRLRIIPFFPQGIVNFGAALSGVSFPLYVAATAIGLLPTCIVYAYFADSLLSGIEGERRNALINMLTACGLLLALSFLPMLASKLLGTEHED